MQNILCDIIRNNIPQYKGDTGVFSREILLLKNPPQDTLKHCFDPTATSLVVLPKQCYVRRFLHSPSGEMGLIKGAHGIIKKYKPH